MRLYFRITLLLMVVAVAVLAAAESAKSLYNKGKEAEVRQDYMAAFEHYRQAYEQKPKELKYRIAFQRTRFLASASHVNKGQLLRDQGNLAEAMEEFVYAAKIDPSNAAAGQEIIRTQRLMDADTASQPVPAKPRSSISKRLDDASEITELTPVSPQPITLEIANDSKFVYEAIGKLAGINVLFDPDYTSRRVTLKLNGVSLQEALDILAFHSNTFWRPVTPNTIFIAANTPAKRKELEQNVLKTFYLSNISAPSELQEVVNAVRTMLEVQKIIPVNSQSAIIVRGTPDQVALAEKIIGDMDKAKPEVIVEVAIMQVRRDRLRDLGIRPPTSPTGSQGPISVGIQPATTATTGTTTGTPATTNNLTINALKNLKAQDLVVNIPTATVNLLYSDGNSKLIQNPQIRALDGQKATLKIGDRIPIATGSFGSGFGAGGLGASGLVNTQFQYIDVGVNVDVTPRVFPNREVGLKMVLEVSSVTGSTNIGGIVQPIISQRKIEHEIRLREGEVNLLGGIFEETDSKSVNGIPGLAQLPFFKYFFSQETKQRVESEIVFILIPRIVRNQDITELNQKALDVGTGTNLDLRRTSRPANITPVSAAPQTPAPQPSVQQQPVGTPQSSMSTTPAPVTESQPPPAAAAAAPQESSAPAAIYFDPAATSQTVGKSFNVNVLVRGGKDIYAAPLQISYDPNTLQLLNISNGDLLSRDGQPVALVHREDMQSGTIQANATRPPNSGGISGDGVLYTLTFQAKFKGDSTLNMVRPSFRNSTMQSMPIQATSATVSIK